jgi:hypothetical protein
LYEKLYPRSRKKPAVAEKVSNGSAAKNVEAREGFQEAKLCKDIVQTGRVFLTSEYFSSFSRIFIFFATNELA